MELSSHPSLRLAAKTAPPRLHKPSLRGEQLARVAEAAEARLLLVRAPAGYGKTTLVAAAASEFEWRHVWYRLDAHDEDPGLFLGSLVAVAHGLTTTGRESRDERLQPQGGEHAQAASASEVVASLSGAQDEHLFYVLDEYDALATTGRFDETIAALLPLLPPTVHFVILSRSRPTFATAKLELDGALREITYRDLLLDHRQAAEVFEQHSGRRPAPAALETLLELTEGWAAGVVLAGKTARWRNSAVTPRGACATVPGAHSSEATRRGSSPSSRPARRRSSHLSPAEQPTGR